jgi:hypothetical protein
MEWEGFLRELEPRRNQAGTVEYQLGSGDAAIRLNECLGAELELEFLQEKQCRACGRKVSKLYQNGYCFPCVRTLAECDVCIVRPDRCHFAQGTCRDVQYARNYCMVPHYVYLAFNSGIKVGLTRVGREQRRWIDQGALAALIVARVDSRREAGELEAELAKTVPDRADWRRMVTTWQPDPSVDLVALKASLRSQVDRRWHPYWSESQAVQTLEYPILPGFEPQPTLLGFHLATCTGTVIRGRLGGIRGQYLLLDHGVFPVQRHVGYRMRIRIS